MLMTEVSTRTIDNQSPDTQCISGKTPLILTGIFIQLLEKHFSVESNIVDPALKPYLWKPDVRETGMVIDTNFNLDWKSVGKRPAIIVKRGNIQSVKLTLDDANPEASIYDDREAYIRGKVGDHTMFCIAPNGGLTEILGNEVSDEFMQFASAIRQDLGFNKFEETMISEVQQIEESDTHFVVAIKVEYGYIREWSLTPEQPVLKVASLDMKWR
jgi:hypothetical protein